MSQGIASKEEAKEMSVALDEIMKTMPKRKSIELIGNFNDLFLFLSAKSIAF